MHVHDERITLSRKTPTAPRGPAVYEIQLVPGGCDVTRVASFSPAPEITNARWMDIARLASGQFRAPGGIVALDDTLALLEKFGGDSGGPIKARAELVVVGTAGTVAAVDGKIDVSDLLAVLDAFAGGSYPFTQ